MQIQIQILGMESKHQRPSLHSERMLVTTNNL